MNRSRKLLLTTLAVGATGAVAGLGVFAAFTATTENLGNNIGAGTVTISDNDGGVGGFPIYNDANRGPGDAARGCITVSYTGSLNADISLYRIADPAVQNLEDFELTIERGSGLSNAMPDCTGFTPAGLVFNDTLDQLGTDFDNGAVATAAGGVSTNDEIDYRFTIAPVDDPTPNAHSTPIVTGAHGFRWEARSN